MLSSVKYAFDSGNVPSFSECGSHRALRTKDFKVGFANRSRDALNFSIQDMEI